MRPGILLVVLLVLVAALIGCDQAERGQPAASAAATAVPDQEYMTRADGTKGPITRGSHRGYSYWYVTPKEGKRGLYGGAFEPFLPRDDDIVLGVLRHLVGRIYGRATADHLDETAHVVERKGRRLLALYGVQYQYLFMLTKEDTGEVNSFGVWREHW